MSFAVLLLVFAGASFVMAVAGFFGNRPSPEAFLAAQGFASASPAARSLVADRLRRTYRGRIVGGVTGGLVGLVVGSRLGGSFEMPGAVIGLLAGTLLGIAFAQAPPSASRDSTRRTASLDVRDPARYSTRPARVAETVGAMIVAALAIAVVVFFDEHARGAVLQIVLGVMTIAVVPCARRLARHIVEQRRPDGGDDVVAVDDVLRAAALRGLHHAAMGLLCCGALVLGVAGVRTQTFTGVAVGDRTVVRIAPGGTDVILFTRPDGRGTVRWRDAAGAPHSVDVSVPTGAMTTVGALQSNEGLVWVGVLAALLGFFGALLEWSWASRAWRPRRRRAPSPVVAVTTP